MSCVSSPAGSNQIFDTFFMIRSERDVHIFNLLHYYVKTKQKTKNMNWTVYAESVGQEKKVMCESMHATLFDELSRVQLIAILSKLEIFFDLS